MPQGPAEVGSTANSYELIAKLAAGGMAEIFLARGAGVAGVERYVVLKRVLPHRAGDEGFVRMFLDEARLAAQLQHPNIAQVYDVGKLGDSYFFTMEYVHGETVRALLQRSHALQRPIPIGIVLAIVAGAAAGLHHAHERKGLDGRPLGIVHRDVSPSNLMVSFEGHVKLVDFGVAKAERRSTETTSGAIKGKISYLSPEQARGSAGTDRRSDLFSLGIVMWELLTLDRLYRRDSDFDNMVAIVTEAPPLPSSRRADVPRELDAIVMRLLAKEPDARFQTAEELHAAIEQLAIQVGAPLSSASLARYLRELFGERPEPWVEMRSEATHGGAVTVTSEPIPPWLGESSSSALGMSPGPAGALPIELRPTIPVVLAPPPAEPASLTARPRRVSPWLILLGPAALVGVVAGIVVARHGGSRSAALDAGAPAEAPQRVVATPVTIAAPADAAAIVAAPADAAAIAAAPPDAAPPQPPAPPPPRAHVATREDLAKAFHAERYVDAVVACSTTPALVEQDPAACVLSACHLHDAARAQRWIKSAAGRRAQLVAACAAAGTPLEPSRPKPHAHPDCEANPLDCQH